MSLTINRDFCQLNASMLPRPTFTKWKAKRKLRKARRMNMQSPSVGLNMCQEIVAQSAFRYGFADLQTQSQSNISSSACCS